MEATGQVSIILGDSDAGPPPRRRERGQSLVETALILPILLLMFIGVLEVGWALRGYLTLLNASREALRSKRH
jgi:Flp pilus assembly protein TadG